MIFDSKLGVEILLTMKSRMNREVHVRFCERLRGENPLCLLDLVYGACKPLLLGCRIIECRLCISYFLFANVIVSMTIPHSIQPT